MIKRLLVVVVFLLTGYPSFSMAGEASDTTRIVVGVRVEPPFVMKDTDGSFYGLSIDLWHYLSDELDVRYEFKEYYYVLDIIKALSYREIDISINPLHVSGTRIRQMEVTQPFFISSLGLAIRKNESNQIKIFISNIFSIGFLKLILTLIGIVVLFGILVWYIEKKNGNKDFRHGIQGVMDGVWWSTVTITTVGYGDKTPKTTLGRVISMIWMFIAISLISSFTATITSTLTVNQLDYNIEYLKDLRKFGRIGTVHNSSSEDYLLTHKISPHALYNTPQEGLDALQNKDIDVLVYEKPVMRFLIIDQKMQNDVKILPVTFHKQYFSLLMPKRSPLVHRVNPELVDKINRDSWQIFLKKYNLEELN